jgi:hypothetical protein
MRCKIHRQIINVKGKVVPANTTRLYGTLMPPYQQRKKPWYPLIRRPDALQVQSEHFRKEEISCTLAGIKA